ncbi:hypothetical protein SteCoe_36476 [Stentor coeruleus]|uniref:Uncharacterized protein n=1 Tax=Stentor coeruleus TaxID=5963 RepID=A0A1R2AQ65_9CILI|nr:hypothetical protein SteCoe_36476 [Stentor coeruleus]
MGCTGIRRVSKLVETKESPVLILTTGLNFKYKNRRLFSIQEVKSELEASHDFSRASTGEELKNTNTHILVNKYI